MCSEALVDSSRLDPDPASHSSEKTLTPPHGDSPEASGDDIPIVSWWRQLASKDPESPDFCHLLSFLIVEAGLSSTTELRGDDARDTLNIIGKVCSAYDNTRRVSLMYPRLGSKGRYNPGRV